MSISSTCTDYINWRYLLKGNYRKGVHALREIMGTPAMAQEFCSNSGAMGLVLGHDPDEPDANSEQLRELVLGSAYVDFAIEHWFPDVFPGETAESVTADEGLVAAVVAGSVTAPALAAADKWLARALCTMAGYESISGIDSLEALAGTPAAMTALAGSSSAMAYVATSEKSVSVLVANEAALETLALTETSASALVENDAFIDAIDASQTVAAAAAPAALGGSSSALAISEKSEAVREAMSSVELTDEIFSSIWSNDSLFSTFKTVPTFIQKTADKYASSIGSQSWETIGKVAQVAVNDLSKFSACQGKKKSVAISGNGTHSFTIAGVGKDTGSAFTFVCDDCIGTRAMNSSNTTSGGWEKSAMRTWLSGTLLPSFPADLRAVMKSVSKKNTSGYGAATTSDKLWLLSQTEAGLGGSEGTAYPTLNSNSARIRKNGSSATGWWLRSVYSSTYFRGVGSDGTLDGNVASGAWGVVPGFCI